MWRLLCNQGLVVSAIRNCVDFLNQNCKYNIFEVTEAQKKTGILMSHTCITDTLMAAKCRDSITDDFDILEHRSYNCEIRRKEITSKHWFCSVPRMMGGGDGVGGAPHLMDITMITMTMVSTKRCQVQAEVQKTFCDNVDKIYVSAMCSIWFWTFNSIATNVSLSLHCSFLLRNQPLWVTLHFEYLVSLVSFTLRGIYRNEIGHFSYCFFARRDSRHVILSNDSINQKIF